MTNYKKIKKPERAKAIDLLLMNWAEPKMIAGSLGISENVTHRYINHLGYQKRYINADEIYLITKYRLSKQNPTQ